MSGLWTNDRDTLGERLEAHQAEWIQGEDYYECGCNEDGWMTEVMLTISDVARHQADRAIAEGAVRVLDPDDTELVERLCEVMHNAYEDAAKSTGWETQQASRKPWADVPEANKATMRVAVRAVIEALRQP